MKTFHRIENVLKIPEQILVFVVTVVVVNVAFVVYVVVVPVVVIPMVSAIVWSFGRFSTISGFVVGAFHLR